MSFEVFSAVVSKKPGVKSKKWAEQIGEVPLRCIRAKPVEACTELAQLGIGWWEQWGWRILTWCQRGCQPVLISVTPIGLGRLHDPCKGYIYARKVLMPTRLKCFLNFLSLHYFFDGQIRRQSSNPILSTNDPILLNIYYVLDSINP